MQTWEVSLEVTTFGKGWENNRGQLSRSSNTTRFESETTEEAKKKVLDWVKGRLSRFKPGKNRHVFILAGPMLQDGVFDSERMLRNRSSCSTIPSVLHGGKNKVLVQGYGPEAFEEIHRKA